MSDQSDIRGIGQVEQATAAPGEKRNVGRDRCLFSAEFTFVSGDPLHRRCRRPDGHDGNHQFNLGPDDA